MRPGLCNVDFLPAIVSVGADGRYSNPLVNGLSMSPQTRRAPDEAGVVTACQRLLLATLASTRGSLRNGQAGYNTGVLNKPAPMRRFSRTSGSRPRSAR